MDQEFRLKKIDERRNYLIKEINQNELISKKHKKVCRVLNFIGDSLIAIFTVTGCVSISVGIASSAVGLKMWVITAGIKKYKSTIKKKRKTHDKILLLAKF